MTSLETDVPYRAVIFDLDGTLMNPKVGITRCIQYALGQLGIVVEDADTLTPYIGPPLLENFPKIHGLTPEESLAAVGHYRERFASIGVFENELYPGILDLLAALRERDRTLFIATSKPTIFAEQIAHHFGFAHHFDFIAGSNLDNTRTIKGEVIAHVLAERPGIPIEEMVMVGDRVHDIIGAQHNGMASIGVGYGFAVGDELANSGATAIVDTVEDLQALLLS